MIHQGPRKHHALLKMNVVIGGSVNQKELFALEKLGFRRQVRIFVAFPVALGPRHVHVSLGIGRI